MQPLPLNITIKDIPTSAAIEEHIRQKVQKFFRFSQNIMYCHVVVELSQKNQHVGQLHNVHIKVDVPGKELVATRNASENLWLAIRDASADMIEQLKSYSQHLRRQVKKHPDILHGEIVRLFDDFGFIIGTDGTEYYFNSGNLTSPKKFERLQVGMPVHFIEFMGSEGPQAKRVTMRRHEVPLETQWQAA